MTLAPARRTGSRGALAVLSTAQFARRLFLAAVALFGAASVLGGTAGNGATLLAARGAQGVAAALLQTAVLGLIGATFPAGPARARALSVWGAVGASGRGCSSAGPRTASSTRRCSFSAGGTCRPSTSRPPVPC
jgi:MFS family permease